VESSIGSAISADKIISEVGVRVDSWLIDVAEHGALYLDVISNMK
jgi:hypothetical protein